MALSVLSKKCARGASGAGRAPRGLSWRASRARKRASSRQGEDERERQRPKLVRPIGESHPQRGGRADPGSRRAARRRKSFLRVHRVEERGIERPGESMPPASSTNVLTVVRRPRQPGEGSLDEDRQADDRDGELGMARRASPVPTYSVASCSRGNDGHHADAEHLRPAVIGNDLHASSVFAAFAPAGDARPGIAARRLFPATPADDQLRRTALRSERLPVAVAPATFRRPAGAFRRNPVPRRPRPVSQGVLDCRNVGPGNPNERSAVIGAEMQEAVARTNKRGR